MGPKLQEPPKVSQLAAILGTRNPCDISLTGDDSHREVLTVLLGNPDSNGAMLLDCLDERIAVFSGLIVLLELAGSYSLEEGNVIGG
jgi:hypothetical protein